MRARLMTATGSPSLNASAQRTAEGGMGSPLEAMRTAALCVGWSSHFFFRSRSRSVRKGSPVPRTMLGALTGRSRWSSTWARSG